MHLGRTLVYLGVSAAHVDCKASATAAAATPPSPPRRPSRPPQQPLGLAASAPSSADVDAALWVVGAGEPASGLVGNRRRGLLRRTTDEPVGVVREAGSLVSGGDHRPG